LNTDAAGYFDVDHKEHIQKYFPDGGTTKNKAWAFQRALNDANVVKDCRACGIGACFISIVRLNDSVVPKLYDCTHDTEGGRMTSVEALPFSTLKKFFSRRQLILIEAAFEGGAGGHFGPIPEWNFDWAEGYGDGGRPVTALQKALSSYIRDNGTTKTRMAAIMKNIVANKGEFVPKLQKGGTR
jgi:hypothetical protein